MTRLLFFGRMRDAAGVSEMDVVLPTDAATVGDVCAWLAKRNAHLAEALNAPGTRYAVDQSFAELHAPAANASEIAFMSPLSGG